jgi:cytoskeletal protein CcmA (bactofilin family)
MIDAQSHFNGNYRSDSDLIIEGTFEGEIECNGTVTIAENATMSATVRARNVVVGGSANGEITCDERFTILATGEMRGKAQAATLVVEEGAFFEGEFRMGNSYSAAMSSSYSGWESARKAPEATPEYSMSVDESDLADLDQMDTSTTDNDPFSVDDLWDEDEKAEDQ